MARRTWPAARPITKDTIFRDYSMTKPVTGVAMMVLYEQGKWLPSDPISKYIPEFAHLKVFRRAWMRTARGFLSIPDHAPTMRELMTHTAGFSYGNGKTPADAMYRDLKVMQSKNLQEMIDKLAQIPLLYQPGKGWVYSSSMDIQGYIVEKLSGKSLPEFMREHIYEPLGMRDAGFYVPAEKRQRFATLYNVNPQGELVAERPTGAGRLTQRSRRWHRVAAEWCQRRRITSALHQMLANGGELDGKRVLAPSTVKLMTSEHMPDALLTGEFGIGMSVIRPGFALGLRLRSDLRSGEGEPVGRRRDIFLGRRGGNVVLCGPDKRYRFRGNDSEARRSDNHALEYRATRWWTRRSSILSK